MALVPACLTCSGAYLKDEEELPGYLYDRLLDLFHQYVVVGGMPDAVNSFLATRNVDEVRNIHRDLHALYRDDIAKYAPPELRLVIRDIYDLIPSEAGSKNKRFKLSSINGVKRFSQVNRPFSLVIGGRRCASRV